MRYRPFAHHNISLSAVSLTLGGEHKGRSVEDWVALLYAALECGVNSFEIRGQDAAALEAFDRALQFVERRLVFVTWRLGAASLPGQLADLALAPETIQAAVGSLLARSQLGYIDLLLLDDPGVEVMSPPSLAMLRQLKDRGPIRFFGVAGHGEETDGYISSGAFDALAIPYNMTSGWLERLRLRAAQDQNMALIGYDYCPPEVLSPERPPERRRGLWGRNPDAVRPAPYDFLHQTPNWIGDEICLAFALTEPALASLQVEARDLDHLQTLAAATDRQMPPGLAAQIEMARFSTRSVESKRRRA